MTDRIPVDHGRIRMLVPGDWQDRSTLLFVAPPHQVMEAPLTAKRTPERHRAISVTLDPTDAGSAEAYLRELGVDSIDSIGIAGRHGACAERSVMTEQGVVRQLVAVAIVADGLALLAVGSVDAGSFDAHRAELVELIGAIELR